MRELHWTTKTEQKLALGGWHSANALALLFLCATGLKYAVYVFTEKLIVLEHVPNFIR